MARITNITRSGRGKAVRTEITGIRELEATVRDLIAMGDSPLSVGQRATRARWAREQLSEVLGDAAGLLKSRIRANAEAQHWPRAVIAAIFTFADISANRSSFKYNQRQSALAGIRKGAPPRRDPKIYREWNPGASWSGITGGYLHPTGKRLLKKGLVSGRKIGMSLASMFEFGTSKMQARPAFRPALKAVQAEIIRRVASGYRHVIEKFAAAA